MFCSRYYYYYKDQNAIIITALRRKGIRNINPEDPAAISHARVTTVTASHW